MKTLLMFILTILSALGLYKAKPTMLFSETPTSFYDFKMKTLDGKDFDFHQLKGKKVLLVNTASKCGYTPQYAELEKLQKAYGSDKFVILGFPANNFMGQEPGSNSEIREFCTKNYGVSFTMFEKISVKGKDQHPLYQWLTNKSLNSVSDADVKWNFNKFLVDESGHWVSWLGSGTGPMEPVITDWIKTGKKPKQ